MFRAGYFSALYVEYYTNLFYITQILPLFKSLIDYNAAKQGTNKD